MGDVSILAAQAPAGTGSGCDQHRPKLLYAADIARALSSTIDPWTTRRAWRWMQREGLGFQLGGKGSPWVTTTDRLIDRFPELLDVIVRELDQEVCHWCGRPRE